MNYDILLQLNISNIIEIYNYIIVSTMLFEYFESFYLKI